MNFEEWRPCLPNYEVSNLGRVRRSTAGRKTHAGRVMAVAILKIGYRSVSPVIGGKNKTHYVHDLVAAAFIGPKPAGASVNHIDGIKTNNVPANLEYVTHAQNMRHAADTGLMAHGEAHGGARLKETDVAAIRADRALGLSYSTVARRHGVSISHAWQIANGNAWKHSA